MGQGLAELIIRAQEDARRRQQEQQQYDASANAPIPGYTGSHPPAQPTAQPLPRFGNLQDAVNYLHAFPIAGGGQSMPYQFGQIPGMPNAGPAPLNQAGIPTTPVGPTPSQSAAPPPSGSYGLLAQQMAGVQPGAPSNAPGNTPGMLPLNNAAY